MSYRCNPFEAGRGCNPLFTHCCMAAGDEIMEISVRTEEKEIKLRDLENVIKENKIDRVIMTLRMDEPTGPGIFVADISLFDEIKVDRYEGGEIMLAGIALWRKNDPWAMVTISEGSKIFIDGSTLRIHFIVKMKDFPDGKRRFKI